jgi:hypothetical protein
MNYLLLAHIHDLWHIDLWYALPAVVAISLVYAATRHERIGPLLIHAGHVAVWLVGFMAVVFALLECVGWLA